MSPIQPKEEKQPYKKSWTTWKEKMKESITKEKNHSWIPLSMILTSLKIIKTSDLILFKQLTVRKEIPPWILKHKLEEFLLSICKISPSWITLIPHSNRRTFLEEEALLKILSGESIVQIFWSLATIIQTLREPWSTGCLLIRLTRASNSKRKNN